MTDKTIDDFKEAFKAMGAIRFHWPVSSCHVCHQPLHFVFTAGENFPVFDDHCDCRSFRERVKRRSWQDVADHYNKQTDPAIVAHMNKCWGFKDTPAKQREPTTVTIDISELQGIADQVGGHLACYSITVDLDIPTEYKTTVKENEKALRNIISNRYGALLTKNFSIIGHSADRSTHRIEFMSKVIPLDRTLDDT